jgi:hypothetical protein
MTRVVLVRPWVDVRSGGGCCGGDPEGVCLDRSPTAREHDDGARLLAETYQRLRSELPEVEVQVVSAGNLAYLLPTTFSAVRRQRGVVAAVREAGRATTAGAVLVEGERVGDIEELGPDGVVALVRDARATAEGRPRQDSNLRPTD